MVIPAYKVRAFVADAVRSVLAQTYQDVCLVVVNDGSTDGTEARALEAIAGDKRVVVLTQENAGFARGCELVGVPEKVLFLDGDDRLRPNAIDTLYANSLAREVVGGLVRRIDEKGELIDGPAKPFTWGHGMRTYHEYDFNVVATGWPYVTPGQWLWSGRLIKELVRFDPHIRMASDWELLLRAAASGLTFSFCPESVAEYRRRAGQDTAISKMRFWQQVIRERIPLLRRQWEKVK